LTSCGKAARLLDDSNAVAQLTALAAPLIQVFARRAARFEILHIGQSARPMRRPCRAGTSWSTPVCCKWPINPKNF
jgi:hypothetical protein